MSAPPVHLMPPLGPMDSCPSVSMLLREKLPPSRVREVVAVLPCCALRHGGGGGIDREGRELRTYDVV